MNLGKDDFKQWSQEFDSKTLYLFKQLFYPYQCMSDFENFKEKLPSKEKFYSSLIGKKISNKENENVLKVWDKFEMKAMKFCHDCNFIVSCF